VIAALVGVCRYGSTHVFSLRLRLGKALALLPATKSRRWVGAARVGQSVTLASCTLEGTTLEVYTHADMSCPERHACDLSINDWAQSDVMSTSG
jgi:hypothetical protein